MFFRLRDPSQQLCRQGVTFVATALYFGLSRRRQFTFEHLRAQFHPSVADRRMHANWRIAITVQSTQKFSLCPQTKQRFVIVYGLEKCFCALIIRADLDSNDSLTTRWYKNFARKNLKKQFPAFEGGF